MILVPKSGIPVAVSGIGGKLSRRPSGNLLGGGFSVSGHSLCTNHRLEPIRITYKMTFLPHKIA
jgi:hypothetical protein